MKKSIKISGLLAMHRGKPQFAPNFYASMDFLTTRCSTRAMLSSLFIIVSVLPLACGDMITDRLALLAFATAVRHDRMLNWNPVSPVCLSWVGINCSADGRRVIALQLRGFGLTGPIPFNTLGRLTALRVLSLQSNRFSGNLPSDILALPSLDCLFLQNNSFSGGIPNFLSPQLSVLDLSFNSLTGSIPPTLQNLTRLTGLNLQNNSLSGPIPDLGSLPLIHFNASNNNLRGGIPSSLHKFPYSSFTGNLLCGPPLNPCFSALPPAPLPTHLFQPLTGSPRGRLPLGAIITIAVGGVGLSLVVAVVLLLCYCKKKQKAGGALPELNSFGAQRSDLTSGEFGSGLRKPDKNKLVFFEGCSYYFDLEDLMGASSGMLGKGGLGTSYKAVLEESTTVVVKRLKITAVAKRDFVQQMEIIDRVGQHPNIAPLRAYYYSNDEKLLVYDYYQSGSLASLLHGNNTSGGTSLDWNSRVKISQGAARGIAHVHSVGAANYAHGNIKSSNVLLSQDLDGCVSDFGLAPLTNHPATSSRVAGYCAPEVFETRRHTPESDVYSFGVVLLETLTGKQPSREHVVDLPRWVESVVWEEWTAEVFDVELLRFQDIEGEMVQMLQIAMACVAKVPDRRPNMDQVVRMLEGVRQCDSQIHRTHQKCKLGL